MNKHLALIIILALLSSCNRGIRHNEGPHDLLFSDLPRSWDEGIPLGNGFTGALVWQKNDRLRVSLDRADLWDLRPMENIGLPEWKYRWVCEQWRDDNYKAVQEMFDAPYDRLPAPSKIPAAAIEFDISTLGKVSRVCLAVATAVCTVEWENGTRLELFVDAAGDRGWYKFTGKMIPEASLVPPAYKKNSEVDNPAQVISYDLERLGYDQGAVTTEGNSLHYHQKGWGGFSYSVDIERRPGRKQTEGWWSVRSHYPGEGLTRQTNPSSNDYSSALENHKAWWKNFWEASSLELPDSLLERQWYLEMYKFGAAARADAPPISLQAVWTADNGQLPPWKGDFHHDLNTQLSYWPAYSSNHTDLASGFTSWMWDRRETFRKYTRDYFETEGLNVPGVSTLAGEPMGGWIQYSFGPTVSAWLAQHFYLQWIYTADTAFLRDQAYPWIRETALHLSRLSVTGDDGFRKYPLSSSPEFNDNRPDAWFPEMTNFDLSLTRWTFSKAAELAGILGLEEERERYNQMLSEWPSLAADSVTGLMIAPGYPYNESHRHFSHLMSIFPLGLNDISNSADDSLLVARSIDNLVLNGTDYWTGYSFAWLGNIYARAGRGDEAASALRTFAECFCLPNSFHVNGDQSGTGKSKFTYRPFTLEGNFAFASAVQEMLLQSHRGFIEIFPAIPAEWKEVSFSSLRAQGAVLVTASMEEGRIKEVWLKPEKGGVVRLKCPFNGSSFTSNFDYEKIPGGYSFATAPGDEIILTSRAR
ncbi:MAG: hypothetical protein MUC78_04800 [Bacteroidales bacterium]|jgi:alpha-L-fucosidase 2|nr:hypothetical protein [Bacteroidales bacterium]